MDLKGSVIGLLIITEDSLHNWVISVITNIYFGQLDRFSGFASKLSNKKRMSHVPQKNK